MRWLCLLAMPAVWAQTPAQPARNPVQDAMEKQRAAAAIQREGVRKQVEMAAQWRSPPLSSTQASTQAEDADCNPIPDVELTPMIDAAAQTHSVQPGLLRAVIERESGMRPCAVSKKGAKGLMQLMPDTAGQLGVEDPFDPRQNIEGGARYLKELLDKYKGDLSLALGAYNAGPSTVDQAGKVPDIPETRDYVSAILKKLAGAPSAEPKPPADPKPPSLDPKPPPPIVLAK